MTHDELLAKVIGVSINVSNTFSKFIEDNLTPNVKALRAVVELHADDYGMCMICKMKNYPCSTIQAIEKELV